MKSIKQIADEIGVTPQTVRNKIKKLGMQNALQKVGKRFVIDKAREAALIQAFDDNAAKSFAKSLQNDDSKTSRLIEMLQDELEIKNRQIDELNARLAETTEALTTSQALHAGTIKQIGEESEAKKEKKSFFSRFKR